MGNVHIGYMIKDKLYKGEIIGFTKNGFAVYPNSIGLNALDSCECCGQIIHSQLSDADFCPICAVMLGLVSEGVARDFCLPRYSKEFDELENDLEYYNNRELLIKGFKAGINFGVKNSFVSIRDVLHFDTSE